MKATDQMTEDERDRRALRRAGVMGHTLAAVSTGPDGTPELSGEFNSLESATRLMSKGGRLYARSGGKRNGAWLRVHQVLPTK